MRNGNTIRYIAKRDNGGAQKLKLKADMTSQLDTFQISLKLRPASSCGNSIKRMCFFFN